MDDKRWTIDELCEATGFTRRTIRYYVAEGLLAAPAGRGRGGFYDESHRARLEAIRGFQARGLSLEAIRRLLSGPPEPTRARPEAARDVWVRIPLGDGIELSVRRDREEKFGTALGQLVKLANEWLRNDANRERDGIDR